MSIEDEGFADVPFTSDESEDTPPVEIPYDSLSLVALRGLIEEFVSRAGTDYGLHEKSMESKVEDVMTQLASGEARVVYDPKTETANIVRGQ